VVHPNYQGQGIGTRLLEKLVVDERPQHITTYTRNPSVLRMMSHVTESLYPIAGDDELRALAEAQPNATNLNGIYHIERYGEGGLFHGADPANRPFSDSGIPLKEQFEGLRSVRNALVVAGRIRKDLL